MRIAVVGAGGVGGYFGGRLARSGQDVTFIARGTHLDALRAQGLRVTSVAGDFVVSPVRATADAGDVGPVDAVIVAVKSWQLQATAESLAPLVGRDTVVLPLLNGVEAAAVLASAVGAGHVLGGLCRILASIEEPGHIRHGGMEPSVVLGELDGRQSERVRRLHEAFLEAGVRAMIADDVRVALWEKFMLIATWSGIGAVTRAPVGVWRSLPGTRAMAESALGEVQAVAQARGVALAASAVGITLAFLDSVPAGGVASMQRDIMEGRPSELEAQSGAVVRLGAEADVAVPTHAFLYHALLPQEQAARARI
jgi:2-dehydropantoate 2-reductase